MPSMLAVAIEAAQEAGAVLREEFSRSEGPQGSGGHAEIDETAESNILDRLTQGFPKDGYLGEELGEVRPALD